MQPSRHQHCAFFVLAQVFEILCLTDPHSLSLSQNKSLVFISFSNFTLFHIWIFGWIFILCEINMADAQGPCASLFASPIGFTELRAEGAEGAGAKGAEGAGATADVQDMFAGATSDVQDTFAEGSASASASAFEADETAVKGKRRLLSPARPKARQAVMFK